ncbi:MAG: response regulator [Candidatus Gorgyraea atricola]|nr:response regulator [Candidatus Gorgyraea atricola]
MVVLEGGNGNSIKVLIVDDERLLIDNYMALLGSERYEFSTATDGSEAMDKLRRNHYDMLITDWCHPPGLDGIGLLREAKILNKDIVVILISGYLSDEGINRAKELGCFAYGSKPFHLKKLRTVITKAFAERKRYLR